MSEPEVFFTTADVSAAAERLKQVTAEYEELFNNLCKQIFISIKEADSPSAEVAVTLQYIQDSIQAFEQNFPSQYKAACGKGCAQCCHFPIDTTPQVVEDIALYLEANRSKEELEELKLKLQDNIAARQPPLFRALCPFLSEEHACSIYEKRPLACRWFLSPDANLCAQSVVSGQNITQHPVHSRIYEAASTALLAAEQRRSGSALQVKFIPALLGRLCQ